MLLAVRGIVCAYTRAAIIVPPPPPSDAPRPPPCQPTAGALALLLASESLTKVLSSSARSMPPLGLARSSSSGGGGGDGAPRRPPLSGAGGDPAWTGGVDGCTGPEDGFVYGGGAGKVLTFARRGRGAEKTYSGRANLDRNSGGASGGGDGGAEGFVDDPALPDVLRWFWTLKHDRGVLAYEVPKLEERRDVGGETGWEVVFLSNVGEIFGSF